MVPGSMLKEPDRNVGGSRAKLPFSFENLEPGTVNAYIHFYLHLKQTKLTIKYYAVI